MIFFVFSWGERTLAGPVGHALGRVEFGGGYPFALVNAKSTRDR